MRDIKIITCTILAIGAILLLIVTGQYVIENTEKTSPSITVEKESIKENIPYSLCSYEICAETIGQSSAQWNQRLKVVSIQWKRIGVTFSFFLFIAAVICMNLLRLIQYYLYSQIGYVPYCLIISRYMKRSDGRKKVLCNPL